MVTNISGALAGLSLLTGSSAAATGLGDMPAILTRAQRRAKAAFTTPETEAPWKAAKPVASPAASAVKAMRTIIDKPAVGADVLPVDVQTSFTTYRALDRLKVLADAAAKDTTGSGERAQLQAAFAKGMAELQTFLAGAPRDKVDLAFGRAAKEVRTVAVASPSSLSAATITGAGVRDTRDGALAGVTGAEVLRIDLSAAGLSDTVTVDLSTAPQPPTLDGVADAINAAIRAVPQRNADGTVKTGADGQPVPRWSVTVEPSKTGDKWGLSVKRGGFETVAIDQVGAGDALMVAGGITADGGVAATRLTRFDDPAGGMTRRTYGTITATDAAATERAKMAYEDAKDTKKKEPGPVAAAASAAAIATDAQGFSYVVGTTAGDMDANRSAGGKDDLFLTKVDSEGQVVWRRNLGAAGSSSGAAVTVAPDGGIVVAGSVQGAFDGATSDGDVLVARFDAQGNESFSTVVRSVGKDGAEAVAVGADGTIFVGGRTEGGAATLARLDASGKLAERRVIDGPGTDRVRALAVAPDGGLVALTAENGRAVVRRLDAATLGDAGSLDLGRADAGALAIDADGSIAVVGGADGPLTGAQVNAHAGGRDAFVTRLSADLSGAATTYLGTGAEETGDSVAFMNGAIYVGGRTGGALAGAKSGGTDAFVARVDADTGAVGDVRQWGTPGVRADATRLTAVKGGNSVLGALGLHRGTLTPTDSVSLEAQTGLRAGDEFSLRVNGGAAKKIVIAENETLTSLADKVRRIAGTRVAGVTTPASGTGRALSISAKPGNTIELVAGTKGRDALEKLGLDARRIAAAPVADDDAPKVSPGGSFGLDLSDVLQLGTKADAKVAQGRIKQAISYTQSAYRSLYWDDLKASLADTRPKGSARPGSTAIQKAQLANYQAALDRLGTTNTGIGL